MHRFPLSCIVGVMSLGLSWGCGGDPGGSGTSTGAGGGAGGNGECAPGSMECSGTIPAVCNALGQWELQAPCPAELPVCVAGSCAGPSCLHDTPGAGMNCGPGGDESCCASPVIPGGTFNRIQLADYPATVSDFRMDRFLITVGRFREFLQGYPANKPVAGAGAHSKIPGSGWDPAWDTYLPPTADGVEAIVSSCMYASWTHAAGANEHKILDCTHWFLVFAFCAWDGGRLPTEAEWNYVAAGGAEQRFHPWGAENPDSSYAVYDCIADGSASQACALSDVTDVGSRSPKGDSKWGIADLVGGAWEWTLDNNAPLPVPCVDCAIPNVGLDRSLRGGSWSGSVDKLNSVLRNHYPADGQKYSIGGRCARNH